jgi:hypothetical protein
VNMAILQKRKKLPIGIKTMSKMKKGRSKMRMTNDQPIDNVFTTLFDFCNFLSFIFQ